MKAKFISLSVALLSGISVWATCNVGAEFPEDNGNYYAWGEVMPKNKYVWTTYKYANGANDKLTKYCSFVGSGTYLYGTQVRLEAGPNSGYKFLQWSNGITRNPYLFTAEEDMTLVAQFIPATAVENVSAEGTTPHKIIRNGQVLILRNGKVYDVMGPEVK